MAAKKNVVVDSEITKEEVIDEKVTKGAETPKKESEAKTETEQAEDTATSEEPKKEGLLKRGLNAVKNGWNSFETKHPKLAKGAKIAGAVGIGVAAGYGLSKLKDDSKDVPELEVGNSDVDLIECDDMYDDYEYQELVDMEETPVDEVETTVEVSEN